MPNVYAIRDNLDGLKSLNLDILDVVESAPSDADFDQLMAFERHNLSMKAWWPGFDVELYSSDDCDDDASPDIRTWVGPSLCLSPKALRLLAPSLEGLGEILPITVNGEAWGIFNCLTMVNADPSKTYRPKILQELGAAEKIGFFDDAADNRVFKTPDEPCITLFCNDWFKEVVESNDLTGISFSTELVEFHN